MNTAHIKPGFTTQVVNYVVQTQAEDLPSHLFDHASLALMDWLSVSVVAKDEPVTQIVLQQALNLGGNAQATITAHRHKVSVTQAALINGSMSHALDYDDTLMLFMGHPTASIMPALLALAEHRALSGKDLLAAYLVGLQVGAWIATAIGSEHYYKGFHGTATVGRMAATAACANLLSLSEQQTRNALGVAGTQNGGLRRSFGSMAKPYHAGMAAEGGVNAVLLAEAGFVAGDDIFEGQFGLFDAMHGQHNAIESFSTASPHPVEFISPKIHAACHCTHAPIEIMQMVAAEHQLAANDIASVTVNCSQVSLENANKTEPKTGLEAKFSINYSMANALINQDTGLKGYTDEKVKEPAVTDLMSRIHVEVDDEHRNADLKTTCHFTLTSGEVISKTHNPIETPPDLATKQAQIPQKFRSLCSMVYSEQDVEHLLSLVENIKHAGSVAALMAATEGALAS